jgi:hypothetical protein
MVFVKNRDEYAIDDSNLGGSSTIEWFNEMGNHIWDLSYQSDDPINVGRLFASEEHLYSVVYEVTGGVNQAVLYLRDIFPFIEIARVGVGKNRYRNVAYHEGVIYIFPADKSVSAYAITEAGAVSLIANPSEMVGTNLEPIDMPWVSNK